MDIEIRDRQYHTLVVNDFHFSTKYIIHTVQPMQPGCDSQSMCLLPVLFPNRIHCKYSGIHKSLLNLALVQFSISAPCSLERTANLDFMAFLVLQQFTQWQKPLEDSLRLPL